jgi:hypothetical protein
MKSWQPTIPQPRFVQFIAAALRKVVEDQVAAGGWCQFSTPSRLRDDRTIPASCKAGASHPSRSDDIGKKATTLERIFGIGAILSRSRAQPQI